MKYSCSSPNALPSRVLTYDEGSIEDESSKVSFQDVIDLYQDPCSKSDQ